MTNRLKISDGVTTLDLLGTVYKTAKNGLTIPPPSMRAAWGAASLFRDGSDLVAAKYDNRQISIASISSALPWLISKRISGLSIDF